MWLIPKLACTNSNQKLASFSEWHLPPPLALSPLPFATSACAVPHAHARHHMETLVRRCTATDLLCVTFLHLLLTCDLRVRSVCVRSRIVSGRTY